MNIDIFLLFLLVMTVFLGLELISKVPSILHTPLMSATNAISGITLIGAFVLAGGKYDFLISVLGFIAVLCATINVVGGYLVTDRMLSMFHSEKEKKKNAN